jgi:PKD repeat protein
MKRYILCALFAIGYSAQAQVTINVTGGTSCFGGSSYQLEADVLGAFGTESYSFETIPYAPETYAGTQVFLSDDAVSGVLPIGFSFCFLGNTYTQFYIGSNGWISFSPGNSSSYTSAIIPNTAANVPKNCIMGPWQDWHPGIGGQVLYQTLGTAPNRRLVVSWFNVPMFSCTGNLGNFQIVCHETTGVIENHLTTKPNCLAWAGGTGTQGVHDQTGTIAFVAPGRNSTQWTTSNESTRFVPSGVSWYVGGTLIGNGDTITVSPTAPTTYTAQVTLCDGSVYTDDVTLSPGPLATVDVLDNACFGDTDGMLTVLVNGVQDDVTYTYLWNDPMAQDSSSAIDLASGTYNVTVTGPGCTSVLSGTVAEPTQLLAQFTQLQPSCNGGANGSGELTATGGTPPYQYSLDNGTSFQSGVLFQNLTPATYDAIVQDANGCTDTIPADVTLTTSPVLTSVVLANPSCIASDGTIDVTATGVDGPFVYAVNGGPFQASGSFGSLGVGSYTITVSNVFGCTSDTTVTLVNSQAPVISAIVETDPSCGNVDGSIQFVVTGGNPAYQYSINNGASYQSSATFSNLSGGAYNLVVTDAAGCNATTTITLIPGDLPVINNVTVVDPQCVGETGCIDIDASGGVPLLNYSFDNGVTFMTSDNLCGLPSGTHTIVVMGGNGCQVSLPVVIQAPDTVVAAFTATPTSGVVPLTVEFTNNSAGATSYLWDFGDGDTSVLFEPNHDFTPKGDYTVMLVATNGICFDTAYVTIQVSGESNLFIPNIFTANGDGVNDTFEPQLTNIVQFECTIYNIWGQQIYYWNTLNGFWDGGTHPDGTYYYVITAVGADGSVYNESGFVTKTS